MIDEYFKVIRWLSLLAVGSDFREDPLYNLRVKRVEDRMAADPGLESSRKLSKCISSKCLHSDDHEAFLDLETLSMLVNQSHYYFSSSLMDFC
jgi:hypothetical protein